jgi:hypothetical protein
VLPQLAYQIVSLTGAALVLLGFAGLQRGWLSREDRLFNALNFVGSALLAWIAIIDRRWGFILLEVIWALLSLPPLLRRRARVEALAANGTGGLGGERGGDVRRGSRSG